MSTGTPATAGTNRIHVRPTAGGWWRAWRGRFGLAEVCCNSGAAAGVVAGYLSTGSLFAAAALATAGGTAGFYGCVGVKTAVAASRVTAHLAGWRRLAAAAWHAVTQQLASCAAAEALDDLLIRPGCLAAGWWLLRPLPGGVWLGFAVGKAAADVAWYGMEACARRGVAAFIKGRPMSKPRGFPTRVRPVALPALACRPALAVLGPQPAPLNSRFRNRFAERPGNERRSQQ